MSIRRSQNQQEEQTKSHPVQHSLLQSAAEPAASVTEPDHHHSNNQANGRKFTKPRPRYSMRSIRGIHRGIQNRQWLQIARIALFLSAALAVIASTRRATVAAEDKPPVPVLVELFTSEGCSSCPPADDLLAKLDTAQPLPGIHAIVLSEHVTYWNQGGWHDPFSSDAITQRQQQYGTHFGLSDVYTPQAVVDGAAQVVGSNGTKLGQAIVQAAATPKTELTIASAQWNNGTMQFAVHGNPLPGSTLFAALAEDSEQQSVLHGENGGHTLHHVAVVRTLQEMGKGSDDPKGPMSGKTLSLHPSIPKGSGTDTGALRLVVFLTDHKTGRVLAVAEQTVPRTAV